MGGESRIAVHRAASPESASLLSSEALEFLAALHREAEPERQRLLQRREERQAVIDAGELPSRREETRAVRAGDWTVPPPPADLQNRQVEITGPTHRGTVIDALNSGANVFKADFEDTNVPAWSNMLDGQRNLVDAVRGTIEDGSGGEPRRLVDEPATLVVRPRGLHLAERAIDVDGSPLAGGVMDAGLFLFHNAHAQLERGTAPYFYLPKLEDASEARWWREIFRTAEEWLSLERGTIRATVLIEHLLAALQTEEILYELGEHAAGLNAGRWDYVFSVVKVFREHPDRVLPDRDRVTMAAPFMQAYQREVVRAAHRRGAHAIGGMSALVPDRAHPQWTESALDGVREDKQREVAAGFDGAWVAHPDLVPVVRGIFDAGLNGRHHQIHRGADVPPVDEDELVSVDVPHGRITLEGVDANLRAALHYLAAWLSGEGAVNLDGKIEDTATAEISRSQVWHWRRHGAHTCDGVRLTDELIAERLAASREHVAGELARRPELDRDLSRARSLLEELLFSESLSAFATPRGLELLEQPTA